jgi:hypothetical protein
MTPSSEDWYKANYSYLLAELNKVRQILEREAAWRVQMTSRAFSPTT